MERKVSPPPQDHQVFISFRGAQLRNNFIGHLVEALRRNEVNVFIDKQENKGEDISHLLERIEESRIAIVVFSSRYTESSWCMREAEKVMERVEQGKLKVLPIFYKVSTANVKELKGEFGDNFRDREKEYRNDNTVIEKWKKALAFISGKLGFTLDDQSSETDFIASIVHEVLKMLASIQLATQAPRQIMNQVPGKGESTSSSKTNVVFKPPETKPKGRIDQQHKLTTGFPIRYNNHHASEKGATSSKSVGGAKPREKNPNAAKQPDIGKLSINITPKASAKQSHNKSRKAAPRGFVEVVNDNNHRVYHDPRNGVTFHDFSGSSSEDEDY